jgi:hypothetical protein
VSISTKTMGILFTYICSITMISSNNQQIKSCYILKEYSKKICISVSPHLTRVSFAKAFFSILKIIRITRTLSTTQKNRYSFSLNTPLISMAYYPKWLDYLTKLNKVGTPWLKRIRWRKVKKIISMQTNHLPFHLGNYLQRKRIHLLQKIITNEFSNLVILWSNYSITK